MHGLTLIHLVSEQTMQNLLPILALRPRRVIQIRSQPPAFQRSAEHLAAAVQVLGRTLIYHHFSPEFLPPVVLPAASPSTEDVRAAVARCLAQHADGVVNFTGGTKLMSISAWQAAREARRPVLYCDTQERRFAVEPAAALHPLPDLAHVAASLTVEAAMAAHGTPPLQWVSTACTPDLLAFGREAFAIRAACGPESRDPGLRDYDARLREHFHCGRNDRLPEARKELAALRDKPLPVASSPSATRLLEAAVKARLLRRGTPGQFLPTCAPERHALEHLANLLEGTWFELYVLDLAQRCPDLVDLHWSVRPKHQELAAFGETDIVGVDTQAIGLRVISCKTSLGGRQPLEHMEALAQRSRDESADPKHLDAGNSLQALAGQAQATDSFDSLRGYEGYGAALYFDRLRRYFPETAPFNGRNRRPPKDAANALLSWTYTIVLTEIDAAVRSAGLDPCLGFLHEISYGRPSLSLDLLEPLRAPLCDMLVLGLLNHRLVRAEEHFETSPEDGGVTLNDRGRRAFFPEYERTMQRRFAESEDAVVAYRICQSCVRQAESMGVVPALGKRVCYIL